jgi:outer membrane protein assembly factor BamB
MAIGHVQMITKAMRLAVLATVLFTLVACSSTGTSVPKPTQLQAITSQLQLVKHWSVAVGAGDSDGHSVRQPVIAEEQIIAVAAQGNVAAYTLDKGVINWQVDLAEPISAGVGQAGKLLLLATQSGKLLALDIVDGNLVWQAKTSSEVLTVPQANASIVVVQTIDGKVSAYQVSDGQFLWSYTANLPSLTVRGTSTPVVTENFTYAGFANGRLVALDNQSGKLIWQQSISAAKGRSEIERLVDIDGALKLVYNTMKRISADE